jgi:hypothetical protein
MVSIALLALPALSLAVSHADLVRSHYVEGVSYLRADYSVDCRGRQWEVMGAYAGFWLLVYVMAFPLFVLYKLWGYRAVPTVQQHRASIQSRTSYKTEHLNLHFLLHGEYFRFSHCLYCPSLFLTPIWFADYKKGGLPIVLWEGIEMIRKLQLAGIGAFWR